MNQICLYHLTTSAILLCCFIYSFYEQPPRKRESIKELHKEKTTKARKGCINPPLLDIDLDNVVLDELHLLLRVTDKLMTGIVLTAQREDEEAGHIKTIGPRYQ